MDKRIDMSKSIFAYSKKFESLVAIKNSVFYFVRRV